MFKPPWGQHPIPLEEATNEVESNVYEKMAQAESEEAEAKVEEAESQTLTEDTKESEATEAGPSESASQTEQLAFLAKQAGYFFKCPMGEAYVRVSRNGHVEVIKIASSNYRHYLRYEFEQSYGKIVNQQTLENVVKHLESFAIMTGKVEAVCCRIGGANGNIYVDLGNPEFEAVEITPLGWSIVKTAPVNFFRSKGHGEIPKPVKGGSVELLKKFVNIISADDFALFVSWLVASLRPLGPYVILIITGEQGAAKSTLVRLSKATIDPAVADNRIAPDNARDLFISAKNTWIVAWDNLSECPEWLSDALCLMATSGVFCTRKMYADDEETIIRAMRPVALASIVDLIKRGDMAERSILLSLPEIKPSKRKDEKTFWAEFEVAKPLILGALFDAVSAGLAHIDAVNLADIPRMADFAKWAYAAAEGLPWSPEEFLHAYLKNQKKIVDLVIDADPVAVAVLALMENQPTWCDTATATLNALEQLDVVTDRVKKSRNWPGAANKLRGHLQREAAFLRTKGIEIEFDVRDKSDPKNKKIKIKNTLFVPAPPPVPSVAGSFWGKKTPEAILPDISEVPSENQTTDLFEPVEEVKQGTAEKADEDVKLSQEEEADQGTYKSVFDES